MNTAPAGASPEGRDSNLAPHMEDGAPRLLLLLCPTEQRDVRVEPTARLARLLPVSDEVVGWVELRMQLVVLWTVAEVGVARSEGEIFDPADPLSLKVMIYRTTSNR